MTHTDSIADILAEFHPYAYPATKERGHIADHYGIEAMAREILKLRFEQADTSRLAAAAALQELERRSSQWMQEIDRLRKENDALHAAIARVRALHVPETYITRLGTVLQHCKHCRDDAAYYEPYPCPTLRALDKEKA